MPTDLIQIDSLWKRVVLLVSALAIIVGASFAAVWAFANTIALKSNEKEVAELSVSLAPGDPQTHYAVAVQFEKTFEPADIERSLAEFEKGAALSPNNYLYWTALGKARERSGDRDGAEAALRHAVELAPNYARVRWALGNVLVRQGKADEGFAEIRLAVDSDKSFAAPAASAALQVFAGDLAAIEAAFGKSGVFSSNLASILADQKRFDDAMAIWNRIPIEERKSAAQETGKLLVQKLVENNRYRLAASIADESAEGGDFPVIGRISNCGFENGVKMQNPAAFEWQIAPGSYPQIALTDGQKDEGAYSLVIVFGASTNLEFRSVSQTIPVEPGIVYWMNFSYKAELKTNAAFRWEVVSAADGKRLSASDKLDQSTGWSRQTMKFTVPAVTDGVTVRLIREACVAPLCTTSGRIWFDNFQLGSNS